MFDIANQLLTRHSPFAPLVQMNERQSLYHSQSKVVWRIFSGLWLPKHWKIRIATDSDVQTFLEGKDNQKEKNWGEKKDYS